MLSDEKVSHLTHAILKGLLDRDTVDIIEEEGMVRKCIKRAIQAQLKVGAEMDIAVKKKISSLSRNVSEGSPEWNVLYDKYLMEEESRHGMGGSR